jgi:hypothetical protein
MPEKSKFERVKETVTLLKKLPKVGVPVESYAYSQVQDLMTAWVNDGPATRTTIDFESHIGELVLPVEEGKVSSLDLKAKNKKM